MARIGEILAAGATPGVLSARRLLNGVTPQNYARLARPGGQVVQSNHPAFVLGHLALYPAKVLARLGRPAGATACPETWTALFEAGAECRDDADGKLYPALDELTARFFAGYEAAAKAVATADDAALLAPNTAEGRSREMFPTIGAAVGFYLSGHVLNHLGQLSAWRRCVGLGPAT
jgi:hypothetical protein